MFKQDWERVKWALMGVDALATSACFVGAYEVRALWVEDPAATFLTYLAFLPLISPLWVCILMVCGAYKSPVATPPTRMAGTVCAAVGVGMMQLILLVFVLKLHFVSRMVVFSFGLTNIAALVAIRLLLRWHLRRVPAWRRRILVVGTGERARRAVAALAGSMDSGCEVIGCIDIARRRAVGHTSPVLFLGTVGEIAAVLKENVIDEIVLAIPRSIIGAMERVVLAAETEGVRVRLMADFFHAAPKRLSLDECGTVPFLTLDWVAYEDWKLALKRLIDVVLSASALVLTAPLFAAVAVAIKLDSPGPVWFVQTRVGRNKRTFHLFKFRTMSADAELRQAALEPLNEARGPVFKITADPRVTRIGRFLRRTSLDELPQLWNVLRGDMSLVGPRPLPLRDVSRFDEAVQRRRFSVKPGITCLWQVSGRSKLAFSDWLRLDLWYIDNWSLSLDFKVLLRTLPSVLRGTGAV